MGNTIYKNIKEYKNGNKEIFRAVSYTHLDVYKRQYLERL